MMTETELLPFDNATRDVQDDAEPASVCDGCPGCIIYCRLHPLPCEEHEVFRLLFRMTEEISLLEEELVRWRQALIKYLPERWADGLFDDIFSNLSFRFYGDDPVYDRFVDEYCSGIDPLESNDHVQRMLRLRDGTDETTIDYL